MTQNIDFEKIMSDTDVKLNINLSDVDEENLAIQDFAERDTISLQHEIDDELNDDGFITPAK